MPPLSRGSSSLSCAPQTSPQRTRRTAAYLSDSTLGAMTFNKNTINNTINPGRSKGLRSVMPVMMTALLRWIWALVLSLGVSFFVMISTQRCAVVLFPRHSSLGADAYWVNDTTLELYLTAAVKGSTTPFTQAILPERDLLLAPTPSLSSIGPFIDEAPPSAFPPYASSSNRSPSSEPFADTYYYNSNINDNGINNNINTKTYSVGAPCYFDVPDDVEDDFFNLENPNASIPGTMFTNPPNGGVRTFMSLAAEATDPERHAYYRRHRACSFIELVGTHNLPFRAVGRAAMAFVNASVNYHSVRRWSSGGEAVNELLSSPLLRAANTASSASIKSRSISSGNSTMVTAVATLVKRSYWFNVTTGTLSAEPLVTSREPGRGIFLRLVGMSTVSQLEASLVGGSDNDVAGSRVIPANSLNAVTAAQRDATRRVAVGIRRLMRRFVTDQRAFDAVWQLLDNAVDDSLLDSNSGAKAADVGTLLRVRPQSPAILFDDSDAALEALEAFAQHDNFTYLMSILNDGSGGGGQQTTATATTAGGVTSSSSSSSAPATAHSAAATSTTTTDDVTTQANTPSPTSAAPSTQRRALALQREALMLFSSWLLMNNNNLRGTTSFTDINGVAEFPYFRGLDCVQDNTLWLYVRRSVPSLSDSDAILGLRGVNRTVVLGDMRMTLRPASHQAFVLADDDEDGPMLWDGALMGSTETTEMTRTQTMTLRRTVTQSLAPANGGVSTAYPPEYYDGSTATSATPNPIATTSTVTAATATIDSTTAGPTDAPTGTDDGDDDASGGGGDVEEYRQTLRRHVYLRPSAQSIGRNVSQDMGEVHEALRFVLLDSCGRPVKSVGRLSLRSTAQGAKGTSYARPSLSSVGSSAGTTGLYGGGMIGAVVSTAQLVEVAFTDDAFTNMTNRHSPRHAAYARAYLGRVDYSDGIDHKSLTVTNITLSPALADPSFMYRFTVDEPLWSKSSSQRLLGSTVWYAGRPWGRSAYKALATKANTVFNVPPRLKVWGLTFDCVAVAQNTSGRMRGSVDFMLSARSDASRPLGSAHGDAATARLPYLGGYITNSPTATPLGFTFSAQQGAEHVGGYGSVAGGGDTASTSTTTAGSVLPPPLAGLTNNSLGWSPMFLSPSEAFPPVPLLYGTAASPNATNRDPTALELLIDAVGGRYAYGLEKWKEAVSTTLASYGVPNGGALFGLSPTSSKPPTAGAASVYTPRARTFPFTNQPTASGATVRRALDANIFTIVATPIATTLTIEYSFNAQPAAETRPAITKQPIPITFSIGYGDEQLSTTRTGFGTPRDGPSIFAKVFPLEPAEAKAPFNRDGTVLAADGLPGAALSSDPCSTSWMDYSGTALGGLSGGTAVDAADLDASDIRRRIGTGLPLLRSGCDLRASEVARRGLIIRWVTPLNILSDSVRSAADLLASVDLASSHTLDAAPRAFMWAAVGMKPLDLAYRLSIVTRSDTDGSTLGAANYSHSGGGSGLFLFNQTNSPTAVSKANATSSAFLSSINFIHQLYLAPMSSYYTHLDEEVYIELSPRLVRSPYRLAYNNFTFRILATDVSKAEHARNWLSLLGMWGRTSSVGTVSSVMSVASCSTDAGMALHLALHPLYIPIGDGPARYFVGAVIMNTVIVIVFCLFVLISGRFTRRFGADSFPNEAIILAFLLYPGTAFGGMNSLAWLNDISVSLRYLVMIIVIVHVIGFPIAFFVLGFRRRPQWEQTKLSDEVDGKGDVLGGMSRRQKMALKKRQKRQQKQREAEQLRTKQFGGDDLNGQLEVDRIMGAMNAKLGQGGRSQAMSLLKFFTPEGHYVMVHSDHLRFESTYAIFRGPAVNLVVTQVLFPFLIACCAFLNCPDNAYMALGLLIAHVVFTFIFHPHITLGRNLVVFTADALLIVATGLQTRSDESVSRAIYLAASLLCSCCNIVGLCFAFWTHRWWRGTVRQWNKTLRRWSLRGPTSKRAHTAELIGPWVARLQSHLDALHAERPDVIYRNKRRLTLMSQIVHQKMINAQELDETVELDPRELLKDSAEMEALGMVGREDSDDSLPEGLEDADVVAARLAADDERSNRKRAFSSYKKAVASAKSEDYFDKTGSMTGDVVNRFLAATGRAGKSKAAKGASTGAEGGLLQAPLLVEDYDEDTYLSGGDDGPARNDSIHNCLYSPEEMETFYSKPENEANRTFDPFTLDLRDAAERREDDDDLLSPDDHLMMSVGKGTSLHTRGGASSAFLGSGEGSSSLYLRSLDDPSPPRPRLGPQRLPPIRNNLSITGSFESASRFGGMANLPDRRGGGGGDGATVSLEGGNRSQATGGDNRSATGLSGVFSARRRAAMDRMSQGSAGERNAVADAERLRQVIKDEKRRFEQLNEQRLQQYVYGSRREVMTNPEGTLILPELPEWAADAGNAMDNTSFAVGSGGGVGGSSPTAAISSGLRGMQRRAVNWDATSGVVDELEGTMNGTLQGSETSWNQRRSSANNRSSSRRSATGGGGGDGGVYVSVSASPNIADKILNRSHRSNRGGPTNRHTFGRDDDEGTVVHVFLTPQGMEESRVSTSAADRTLQLSGANAVERMVTREASKRVRTAFNSNIFSPEEVAARRSAMETSRRIRRSGKGAASQDNAIDDIDLLPERDIFGRYRKPRV